MGEKTKEIKVKSEIKNEAALKEIIDYPKYKKMFFWKGTNIEFQSKQWDKKGQQQLEHTFNKLKPKEKTAYCLKNINTIRYKTKKLQKQDEKEKQKYQLQSNASIVEWDDGSMGIIIGSTHYEIQKEQFSGQFALQSKNESCQNLLAVQDTIDKKLVVKPKTKSQIPLE